MNHFIEIPGFPLKIRLVFLVLVAMSACSPLSAQRNFGVVFNEKDYQAIPIIAPPGGIKGDDFPKKVSLRPFCPQPGHQHDANSCTAFAVGYGAMTSAWAIRQGITQQAALARQTFSAAFIYNQVKSIPDDCREGISVEAALRLLKAKGNCHSTAFDTVCNCTIQPAGPLLDSAKQHRIRDFAAILPYGSGSGQVINTLCSYLRDSVPVVAVMRAYERFVFPRPGEQLWKKRPGERELGIHCIVVTGYDEDTRTFEVLSSWGAEWADGGFCRVAWEDMGVACLAAYVLFPSGQVKKNQGIGFKPPVPTGNQTPVPTLGTFTLEGNFDLMRLAEVDTGYIFRSEAVQRDPRTGFYTVRSGPFPLQTLYQLRTSGTAGGQYLYIFSCDAAGKTELHYPKPMFSALSPGRHALVIVPSPQSALQLNLIGNDLICILYSEREIPNLAARLAGIRNCRPDNFTEKLHTVLGDLLVESAEGNVVEYDPDRMFMQAQVTTGKGIAVPLVLRLEAR